MATELQVLLQEIYNEKEAKIIPENIRSGVSIFDIDGTYEGNGNAATSDGTLQAKYLLEGYTAVVNGEIIYGTMKSYGAKTIVATHNDILIPEGHYTSISIPVINPTNCIDYNECSQAIADL